MDCRKPLKTLGNLLVWPPEASRRPPRHLQELPGGLQGPPRGLLEPPESPLEPLGRLLEPCRSLLEPLLERLESLLSHSEPSWNLSWSLWKALEPPETSCSILQPPGSLAAPWSPRDSSGLAKTASRQLQTTQHSESLLETFQIRESEEVDSNGAITDIVK